MVSFFSFDTFIIRPILINNKILIDCAPWKTVCFVEPQLSFYVLWKIGCLGSKKCAVNSIVHSPLVFIAPWMYIDSKKCLESQCLKKPRTLMILMDFGNECSDRNKFVSKASKG